MSMTRRDILLRAGGIIAASVVDGVPSRPATAAKTKTMHPDVPTIRARNESATKSDSDRRSRAFNGVYQGDYLNQIAFPMGGIGAGMICLEGTGALSKFSLRNRPDLMS